MKNNGRRIFMQQFRHVVDIDQILEMRELIESICRSTGDSAKKVQSYIAIGLSPPGELRASYDMLRKLVEQTHAWVVRDDDGLYRIERRVYEATVLHNGWEMDNAAWVVNDELQQTLRTTKHGYECEMTREELMKKIAETEASLDELKHAAKLMGW